MTRDGVDAPGWRAGVGDGARPTFPSDDACADVRRARRGCVGAEPTIGRHRFYIPKKQYDFETSPVARPIRPHPHTTRAHACTRARTRARTYLAPGCGGSPTTKGAARDPRVSSTGPWPPGCDSSLTTRRAARDPRAPSGRTRARLHTHTHKHRHTRPHSRPPPACSPARPRCGRWRTLTPGKSPSTDAPAQEAISANG